MLLKDLEKKQKYPRLQSLSSIHHHYSGVCTDTATKKFSRCIAARKQRASGLFGANGRNVSFVFLYRRPRPKWVKSEYSSEKCHRLRRENPSAHAILSYSLCRLKKISIPQSYAQPSNKECACRLFVLPVERLRSCAKWAGASRLPAEIPQLILELVGAARGLMTE